MDNIVQLFDVFRNVKYTDADHSYKVDGKSLISVTQFLSRLKPAFDTNFWLLYKVLQEEYKVKPYFTKNGMSKSVIIVESVPYPINDLLTDEVKVKMKILDNKWKLLSKVGTTRGQFAHNYLENLEGGSGEIPQIILPDLLIEDAIEYVRSIDVVKKMCIDYVKDNTHLVPMAIEFRIADIDLGLAGTFDRLYWNKRDQELQIHDFKTDKKIETKGKYENMKLFDLPYCELLKYSIQTSLYKYIIERNTNIKLGRSYITHLNIKDERFDSYLCTDFTKQIDSLKNGDDWKALIQP